MGFSSYQSGWTFQHPYSQLHSSCGWVLPVCTVAAHRNLVFLPTAHPCLRQERTPGDSFSIWFYFTTKTSFRFRFSANKEGNEYYGSFFFRVDGVRVGDVDEYAQSSNPNPQGSGTINLYLTAGQEVDVENLGATIGYGTNDVLGYRSWFTGFILFPL